MKIGICQECGEFKRIDVHHIDGNHENDNPKNRIELCSRCHHLEHIELNLLNIGRPGSKPRSEYRPTEEFEEPISWEEIRRQYFSCFPRAH